MRVHPGLGKSVSSGTSSWNGTSRRHRAVAGGGILVGFPSRRLLTFAGADASKRDHSAKVMCAISEARGSRVHKSILFTFTFRAYAAQPVEHRRKHHERRQRVHDRMAHRLGKEPWQPHAER